MNGYFEMKLKKTGETVRVYNISITTDAKNSYATIFLPSFAGQHGNGWQTVKMSALVPVDMWVDGVGFCSKTNKNKIKSRLKLISAEWQCSDGLVFTHEHLEDAISHEAELMGEELEGE